jgi:hypothetical protein
MRRFFDVTGPVNDQLDMFPTYVLEIVVSEIPWV